RADRLRRARPPGRRAQAADDHRRRERLPARHRLRAHPRREQARRRGHDDGHGAHRRARRDRSAPEPCPAFGFRHDDDAQDAARAAVRHGAVHAAVGQGARQSGLPRTAGRSARPHHRGESRVLQGSRRAGVRRLSEADSRERENAGHGAVDRGIPPRQRRHRQPPDAGRCVFERHYRQSRRSGARESRHHGQQERHPVRSESPDGGERRPHRHARRHDARHEGSRDADDRRVHHARVAVPGRRSRARHGPRRGRSAVPEVPAVPGLKQKVDAVFAADGPLARTIPDFEPRSGQLDMAAAVARAFENGGVLLAEAGTGTGKTLAYLVPAILSGHRVLVSTGTKNLQEQIFFKDIPALRKALDVPFTATYMKGRSNYLCLHRLDQINDNGGPSALDVFLPIVREWAKTTDTGDRAELQDLPEDVPFWNDVSATAETCLGTTCQRYEECFVTKMRQRAAESDVVIVNHHLLCADAAVRKNAFGEVIPACTHAILDEAHQFEDVATQYFGVGLSTYRVEDLAQDIERLKLEETEKCVATLRDRGRLFFNEIAYAHRADDRARSEEKMRATPSSLAKAAEGAAMLAGALDIVESTLKLVRLKPDPAMGVRRPIVRG